MAKFLGVISTRYQHPSDELVLEFTDLDLLANFILDETQNLIYEFQQKMEFTNEREILLSENLNKITEIYKLVDLLQTKTHDMERELENIGNYLCNLEKSINCLELLPTSFSACKCTSNPERNTILGNLVQLSEDFMRLEDQVDEVREQETCIPLLSKTCALGNKLLPFLDLYTKILENIELKISKVADNVQEVEELFINAYKISIGACYHKPRHDYASDC